MCGRFTLALSPEALASLLQLNSDLDAELGQESLQPRYNIAPNQDILAAAIFDDVQDRQLRRLRWGLVPSWAKDASVGAKMINARAETVASKPAFREAFSSRRCLIPADGFYEWSKVGYNKRPWYFKVNTSGGFTMAGLWSLWRPPQGHDLATCTIITTEANALVGRVHHRMPVILPESRRDAWLDPAHTDANTLQQLLLPLDPDEMSAHPVDPKVGSPKNDGPDCITPVDTPPPVQDSLF